MDDYINYTRFNLEKQEAAQKHSSGNGQIPSLKQGGGQQMNNKGGDINP